MLHLYRLECYTPWLGHPSSFIHRQLGILIQYDYKDSLGHLGHLHKELVHSHRVQVTFNINPVHDSGNDGLIKARV